MRRVILAICGLVLVAGLPSAAYAEAPPCAPGAVDEAFLAGLAFDKVNPTAVVGRTDSHEVYVGRPDAAGPDDLTQVSLESTTATPLAHPSSITVAASPSAEESFPMLAVRLEAGESARIRISGTQLTYAPTGSPVCRVTLLSAPFRLLAARAPRLQARSPRLAPVVPWDELRFAFSGRNRCPDEPLVATFQIPGQPGRLRIRSLARCEFPDREWVGPSGMRASTDAESGDITFRPVGHHEASLRVTWTVTYAGRRFGFGSLSVRFRHQPRVPTRRIYDSSFDEYINICINRNHHLHARHGRLYCVISGQPGYWYSDISNVRSRRSPT